MKLKDCFVPILVLSLFASCGGNEDLGGDFKPQTYDVQGKVEKGPFVSGSTITIQPMDTQLNVVGGMYSATIQDNAGSFSFGSKMFEVPYAELTANGYFFDEVEGELSEGTLSLKALVDLSDKSTVNVNVLTHLKYQRVMNLVAGGMKFTEANKQAQEELLAAFGLQKYAETDAASYSITAGTDEAAALIAISSLLIAERSEAELTEYLAKLSREFGSDGTFTEATKQQMKEDRNYVARHLSEIKNNVISRYEDLGMKVEVKELTRYFDWDDDGTAGNETLQSGEEVTFDVTALEVPNEGGVYEIHITSPVPVYLENQKENVFPPITSEDFWGDKMYDKIIDDDISLEKTLENNVLTLRFSPLNARNSKTSSVPVYDCLGNILGNIQVVQEGNPNIPTPKLGETGKQVVAAFASELAKGFSELNLIAQYYHHNKGTDLVNQYITPSNGNVENIWAGFYRANRYNLMFKDAESHYLGVFQDYFNVFSAMYYYYMVAAWGDVPYIDRYDWYQIGNYSIASTSQDKILNNLTDSLMVALDNLEEKRNESLGDANEFFFLSKDVARILLADIYMYRHNYAEAEKLLAEVIANGFYALDASSYSKRQTITDLWNNGSGTETIFATRYDVGSRADIMIDSPSLIPVMNYTEVVLAYAEALYKNGKVSQAKIQLNNVVKAKGITLAESDVLLGIKEARMQLLLYTVGNWAFLKRNGLAEEVYGVEPYQLLLPIPQQEVVTNSAMTQNPGYER